ncbi:MAG: LLM class F420-dependent oxidoreductase [Dehalococcoidia bacterium]|nr:LLM class F420-dependent oxidoreductase [Dehalococcoidia bacterium]
MELGVVFPQSEIGTDPAAIRDFAQAAEAMGFTHLLIYDHVLGADRDRPGGYRGVYDKDTQFHEPLVTLGYLAGQTKTIEFCTTVLILPQRQAALVAKQAAEVDILSGGRLRLGVGSGWNEVEYEALGMNFHDRGKRQAEQVELMRALWTGEAITFNGQWHTVTKASINPVPGRQIPVWFGGSHPALLKRVAKLGDGWIPLMGPNDEARAVISKLHEELRAAGRDPQGFGIQAQAQAGGGTPERWVKHAHAWRDLGATHLAIATMNAGFQTPDDHIDAIRRYREAVAAAI